MTSAKYSLFIILAALVSVVACSKSDDGKGGDGRISVLGASKTPGYLPDGTKVDPMSEAEMKETMDALAAPMNTVGTLASLSGLTSDSKSNVSALKVDGQVSALVSSIAGNPQAFAMNVAQNIKSTAEESDKQREEIRKLIQDKCSINIVASNPRPEDDLAQSGKLTGSGSSRIDGGSCPLNLSSSTDVSGNYTKLGNNSYNFNIIYDYSAQTAITDADLRAKTNLVSNSISGMMAARVTTATDAAVMDANVKAKISAETKTMGSMSVELLMDLLSNTQGKSNTGSMDMVFIVKAQGKTILLQFFSTTSPGGKIDTKVYLNGKLIDGSLKTTVAVK